MGLASEHVPSERRRLRTTHSAALYMKPKRTLLHTINTIPLNTTIKSHFQKFNPQYLGLSDSNEFQASD